MNLTPCQVPERMKRPLNARLIAEGRVRNRLYLVVEAVRPLPGKTNDLCSLSDVRRLG